MFNSNHIVLKKNGIEQLQAIMKGHEILSLYHLQLTNEEAKDLMLTQQTVLESVGRLAFKNTIVEDIIYMFSDSQFFTKYDFVPQLHRLIEIFYYYKEITDNCISDEDIITYLYLSFEGPCQDSLSWLEDNQLHILLDALHQNTDIFGGVIYGTY